MTGIADQSPLPYRVAARGVVRCVAESARLLAARRVHLPRSWVGTRLRFADGTTGRVYRETVIERDVAHEPCVLVVTFRLRFVRGAMHTLFRWESLLNTPLFVGFPGLVSKLWLAHDQTGAYRGFYEWDGAERAGYYARCLWRVLALVSASDSIRYAIVPGLSREDALADPDRLTATRDDVPAWARLVAVDDVARGQTGE